MRKSTALIVGLAALGAAAALSQDADPGGSGSGGTNDSAIFRKTVSKTPDTESDHAQLSMMQFWVPATAADGSAVTLEYERADGTVMTRDHAKPLVVSFLEEEETGAANYDILTGDEVGIDIRRDAWAAFSLDDGTTWKDGNLSESALETSFTLADGNDYPGDVTQVVHAVAGNKILVAWTSKYADQGSPRYSLKDELDVDGDGDTDEPLYRDLFDVAGNQGSIDYTQWMHHGQYPFAHVGEVPFSAVWTVRGTVEQVANPQTGEMQFGIRWRKPERLTSAKRDAYYLAIDGVEGAGFAISWQEDPEGLRPGYGEGPGVGWSGATVNHKTDIWYSYIGWNEFDGVDTSDQDPTTNRPKVAERMAMPSRISDNLNGLADRVDSDGNPHPPYIFEDFDGNGIPDLYAYSVTWTNAQGEVKNIVVTEDGRLLNGQTGASRPRMSLEGYTRADGTKSAWVLLAYEETKGLGAGHTDDEPLDIGKDIMYHSFDMYVPDIAKSGTMMNMPETDPASDPENPTFLPLIVNDMGQYQYQTAIGRRPSLVVQPGWKIAEAAANGNLSGMTSVLLLYKDGTERQGGPSDVFMRRFVLPADFDPTVDNPYDVQYLVYTETDTSIVTSSPSAYPASAYPNGYNVRGAVNLSGTTPLTFEDLDNEDPSHGITQRVVTWEQTEEDLGDETWENKYEVAKGHRGFIDGDFVMVMYAHSANWLATSKGHEPYNLYIRRSFDGGVTWTTTPASLGGDGTTYDQIFGVGDRVWTQSRVLGAGEFEPARNVSQLTSSKDTVLDPRYSPTNIGTQADVYRVLQADGTYLMLGIGHPLYDLRNPSVFYAVYETGDATVVLTAGEADPWDLYGSRATNWGDDWETVDVYAQGTGTWEERWNWLENKDETRAGESSVAMSPDGRFAWAVWNQWIEDEDGNVSEADPIFRRLWWDDPVALTAVAGMYTADADTPVELLGSAIYDGDVSLLTYSWDLDGDGVFETSGQDVEIVATGSTQVVALLVTDGQGRSDVDQGFINAGGRSPRVWMVTAEPGIARRLATVDLTARFTNPDGTDHHTSTIDWDDGCNEAGRLLVPDDGKGRALVTGYHAFDDAGLYRLNVTVTDDGGATAWDNLRYLVVYDELRTAKSTVTFPDPGGAGKAKLTFRGGYDGGCGDSKYLKWLDMLALAEAEGDVDLDWLAPYEPPPAVATGKVLFNLGDLAFESTRIDWFVVTSSKRVFMAGEGDLEGQENCRFLVSAWARNVDRVRVKLYRPKGNAGKTEDVIYDSEPGIHIDRTPTTLVDSGDVLLGRR